MIKSLNEAYDGRFTYWCNAVGEISLPWREDDYNGKPSELPPQVRALYRQWQNTERGVNSYVITNDDKLGMGYVWLIDYVWLSEFDLNEDDDVSAELESAAQAIQKMFPYADVYIGTNTDPDGHEIILFIPSDKLVTFRAETAHKEMGLGGEIYDLIRDEFKKRKREQDEDDSCTNSPEKAAVCYHYETGKVETEVMGSGSDFSLVRTTGSELDAMNYYSHPQRNYLIRWHMEDNQKITETWDPTSQSWLLEP